MPNSCFATPPNPSASMNSVSALPDNFQGTVMHIVKYMLLFADFIYLTPHPALFVVLHLASISQSCHGDFLWFYNFKFCWQRYRKRGTRAFLMGVYMVYFPSTAICCIGWERHVLATQQFPCVVSVLDKYFSLRTGEAGVCISVQLCCNRDMTKLDCPICLLCSK